MMSKFTGEFVIQIKFKHKDGGRRNFVSRGLFNELAHCDYICDAIFYESSQVAGEDAERYGKAIRDAGDSADLIVCKVELKPTSTCYVARPKNTPHNPENDV